MSINVEHYNETYRANAKEYKKHYTRALYYPIWQHVIKFVRETENPKILELGCGTGQLAHFLSDQGFWDYTGIDFSEAAIGIARHTSNQRFVISNITHPNTYNGEYNVVIATEVLEHIYDDIGMLKNIKPGTKIIFSVPRFMCKGHVRCFKRSMDITLHYFNQIHIKEIINVHDLRQWFAGWGLIR